MSAKETFKKSSNWLKSAGNRTYYFLFGEIYIRGDGRKKRLNGRGHFWLSLGLMLALGGIYCVTQSIAEGKIERWIDSHSIENNNENRQNPSFWKKFFEAIELRNWKIREFQKKEQKSEIEAAKKLGDLIEIIKLKIDIDDLYRKVENYDNQLKTINEEQIASEKKIIDDIKQTNKDLGNLGNSENSENSDENKQALNKIETILINLKESKEEEERLNSLINTDRKFILEKRKELIESQLKYYKKEIHYVEALLKTANFNAKEVERHRLIEHLFEIENQKSQSAERFVIFYSRYCALNFTIIFSASVAIIALFFIAQKGIKKSPNSLINIFLVVGISVWFMGSLLDAFKLEENYKLNRDLYLEYINLDNEIDSFLATNIIFDENETEGSNSS